MTAWGYLESETNELSQTTTLEHDLFGRTTKTTLSDPDGAGPLGPEFTADAYDSFGNLLAEWNAKNETTLYGYNDRGQRTSVTDPRGYTTDLRYDLLGRNYQVEDPAGNVTTFGYDDLDRTISETQQLSGGGSSSRWYQYDLAGNKRLSVDRRGQATVYGYDERNELRSETWYLTAADAQAEFNPLGGIGYAYDPAGRMNSAGGESFSYDNLDRLQTQTLGYIPGTAILTTTYGARKDHLRNTVSLTIAGVPDFINQYDYDERLWLKNVTQTALQSTGGHFVATKQVVFQHGDDGRLDHLLRYADLAAAQFVAQTDFGYDGGNRLTGINHFKPATGGNVGLATLRRREADLAPDESQRPGDLRL
jgi:YD repeat-containing protein